MTLQELQTAIEHDVNVKICLINNGFLGMVRQWQEMFYDNRYSHVSMGSPDFGKLAEAYRVGYVQCSSRADLPAAMAKARAMKGPVLCEFVVEMEENVYPMVAAGMSNDNIVTDPILKQLELPQENLAEAK